jgi:hypothetical protein
MPGEGDVPARREDASNVHYLEPHGRLCPQAFCLHSLF